MTNRAVTGKLGKRVRDCLRTYGEEVGPSWSLQSELSDTQEMFKRHQTVKSVANSSVHVSIEKRECGEEAKTW